MEWNEGRVRQNLESKTLRIAKVFIPTQCYLLLHDTPSKYLLAEKKRL
jgi:hypothetical protein